MFPKNRRLVPSISAPQAHLVARLAMVLGVSFGGADSPFFRSLWRWPKICRSSVITSVSDPAALARSIRRRLKSASFNT